MSQVLGLPAAATTRRRPTPPDDACGIALTGEVIGVMSLYLSSGVFMPLLVP